MTHRRLTVALATLLTAGAAPALALAPRAVPASGDWRSDPAWHRGPAEWALYDAVRPIYGVPRRYEAAIFTNKQMMDPKTGTKASDWQARGMVEVFKHNLSEMIPTENYTYRFLTTSFVDTSDLRLFALNASSQEDCGTSFKRFRADGRRVRAQQFCYFPDAGTSEASFDAGPSVAFHDTLSLTLRDYPFDARDKPDLEIDLVPDQTDTHATVLEPRPATARYVARETLSIPYGTIDAHHLRVEHPLDGGTSRSDYWFAADPALRHVMVKYEGPYGVAYELKALDWWAYWDRNERRPTSDD